MKWTDYDEFIVNLIKYLKNVQDTVQIFYYWYLNKLKF